MAGAISGDSRIALFARRATSYVAVLVLVAALWIWLQAPWLSARVIVTICALNVLGFFLLSLAWGRLRAAGIVMLLLSVPQLARYYLYGKDAGIISTLAGVGLIAAGFACLQRATVNHSPFNRRSL